MSKFLLAAFVVLCESLELFLRHVKNKPKSVCDKWPRKRVVNGEKIDVFFINKRVVIVLL